MRISDWSSDVCSSDLGTGIQTGRFRIHPATPTRQIRQAVLKMRKPEIRPAAVPLCSYHQMTGIHNPRHDAGTLGRHEARSTSDTPPDSKSAGHAAICGDGSFSERTSAEKGKSG